MSTEIEANIEYVEEIHEDAPEIEVEIEVEASPEYEQEAEASIPEYEIEIATSGALDLGSESEDEPQCEVEIQAEPEIEVNQDQGLEVDVDLQAPVLDAPTEIGGSVGNQTQIKPPKKSTFLQGLILSISAIVIVSVFLIIYQINDKDNLEIGIVSPLLYIITAGSGAILILGIVFIIISCIKKPENKDQSMMISRPSEPYLVEQGGGNPNDNVNIEIQSESDANPIAHMQNHEPESDIEVTVDEKSRLSSAYIPEVEIQIEAPNLENQEVEIGTEIELEVEEPQSEQQVDIGIENDPNAQIEIVV